MGGYSYTYGKFNAVEFMEKNFPNVRSFGVVDKNVTGDKHEIYCVWPLKTGHKMGVVILVDENPGEYGYKIMGEDEGPHYYNCDKKLLERLTPIDVMYGDEPDSHWGKNAARQWREKCNRY